ncbi:MAG: hypothetical protein GEU28_09770 [Dehalococcoidia bacterium]|nr:hypothetical protein [Dehalococcoidia bacterium]
MNYLLIGTLASAAGVVAALAIGPLGGDGRTALLVEADWPQVEVEATATPDPTPREEEDPRPSRDEDEEERDDEEEREDDEDRPNPDPPEFERDDPLIQDRLSDAWDDIMQSIEDVLTD